MASSVTESALADGPVMSMMNKRLRALRKKHNRILQMEERLTQGKPLNKEQEEVLRSKPAILTLIDEYEKLQGPLAAAVQEELDRTSSATASAVSPPPPPVSTPEEETPILADDKEEPDRAVIDILTLAYFGFLFDVKPQSEFAAMMLTRTHERGCCLTYDYVTDDATDLLGEQDLDAISTLGSFLTSRPVYSGVSHKDALRACLQHAKLWLMNADQPIQPGTSLTYSGLREKLNKILASDYFTTTPEMKAPGDVAAAVGKYGASCQVHISEATMVPSSIEQSKDVQIPVVSEICTIPLDTAKVRLQLQKQASADAAAMPKYRGMLGTVATIAREEGATTLWKGIVPGLHRQCVFGGLRIGLYDLVCASIVFITISCRIKYLFSL